MPTDTPFLYDLTVSPDSGFRWRYRGEIPPIDVFARDMWKDVLVQFIVEGRRERRPIGIVAAYSPDLKNGTAHLGVALAPQLTGHGLGPEAAGLFVDYLFRTWNFRKLYGYTPGWNLGQFMATPRQSFSEEGRLIEHEYYDGRYWDLHIMALHRGDWLASRQRRAARTAQRYNDRIGRGSSPEVPGPGSED